MKQDYLWDKTGSDPDIERLEHLLAGFRYSEETVAESSVVDFPSKAKRNLQPWIFAMAACLAVASISIGYWIISTDSSELPLPLAAAVTEDNKTTAPESAISPAENEIAKAVRHAIKPARTAKKLRSASHKQAAQSSKRQRHDGTELTKEERYAYSQLVLALSITSSKLQIVRDSVNGFDENSTNNK